MKMLPLINCAGIVKTVLEFFKKTENGAAIRSIIPSQAYAQGKTLAKSTCSSVFFCNIITATKLKQPRR